MRWLGALWRQFWAWVARWFKHHAAGLPPEVPVGQPPRLPDPGEPDGWIGDWPVSATWVTTHDAKPHKVK